MGSGTDMDFSTATQSQGNTTLTPDEIAAYLGHLSAASWAQRWPVVVYLSVLMVAGLVGNSLVLAVYSLRFPPSATRVFVLAMAVCDLITNLTSQPLQLATIRYAYNTYSNWFCRGYFTFSLLPTQASGALLVLVSVDRYRRICRPLGSQFSSRQALRLVLASTLICMVVFAPFIPLYGQNFVPTDIPDVYASMCWNDSNHVNTPYFKVYVVIVSVVFFGQLLVMGVAYLLIGRKVWQQTKKRRGQHVISKRKITKTTDAKTTEPKMQQQQVFLSSSDPDQDFTDDTSRDDTRQASSQLETQTSYSEENDFPPDTLRSLEQSSKSKIGSSNTKEKTLDQNRSSKSKTDPPNDSRKKQNTSPRSEIDSSKDKLKTRGLETGRTGALNREISSQLDSSSESSTEETGLDSETSAQIPAKNAAGPVSKFSFGKPNPLEAPGFQRVWLDETNPHAHPQKTLKHVSVITWDPVSGQNLRSDSGQTFSDSDTPVKKGLTQTGPPGSSHQVGESKKKRGRKIRSQTTLMMATLTGLYVINWLPHLIMRFLTDDPVNLCENFSQCGYNTHALATRSFYINSAVNALVYGFCNERFRVQCRLLFSSVFDRLGCREAQNIAA